MSLFIPFSFDKSSFFTVPGSDYSSRWAGIANLFWYCDREKGVAGMIASQVLPFGDPAVMGQVSSSGPCRHFEMLMC